MTVLLKVNHIKEMALVVWQGNSHPFVIVHTQDKSLEVGMPIKDWYHGRYYATLDAALKAYKEYDK